MKYAIKLSVYVASVAMLIFNERNYTKDVVQIKDLYQEFIKNYNKLNNIFDFTKPIQIQTIFCRFIELHT